METCDVVIPVGPGHQDIACAAVDSVTMAKVFSLGPFSDVAVRLVDDSAGEFGRSASRNRGAQESRADWLFWLDADDVVLPEVFETAAPYVSGYDAIWGKFAQMDGNCVLDRYQGYGFSEYLDLLMLHPWCSVKIGHFIRREIAIAYPFNVDMNVGEDWDYYLRVWKNERCIKHNGLTYAKRVGYQSNGPKSATGKQWNDAVNEMIAAARKNAGLT